MKSFDVEDLSGIAPLEFRLGGQKFRVPRSLPLETLSLLGMVAVSDSGQRIYAASQLVPALIKTVADEVWDDATQAWVAVDDRRRFDALLRSPRVNVPIETLGGIAMYIIEELTSHPTGAPKPSGPGRSTTAAG